MDVKDKLISKYKLALSIQKIIEYNKQKNERDSIVSLRKLAASSTIEYSIIQRITSAKKDPQFTTVIAISEGLGVSLSYLANVYDSLTEKEVRDFAALMSLKVDPNSKPNQK